MPRKTLGSKLIGKDKSRFKIPTPALVLDLNALEYNIKQGAALAKEHGLLLRPHCKGHKSVRIAKLQKEDGAVGISCATIGEAEVMAKERLTGILITSPIVPAQKIARLIALHRKNPDVMVVVDNIENVKNLARANSRGKTPLQLLIDYDIGQKRTGTKTIDEALDLANQIQKYSSLKLAGIQAYGGHIQHIADYRQRQSTIQEANKTIRELRDRLAREAQHTLIVTGGGTGSFDIDLKDRVYSELQIGSYLFMDVEYSHVMLTPDSSSPFKPSLFVLTSVISSNHHAAIVDAGLKAFATDGPKPTVYSGVPSETKYQFMGDEHGKLIDHGSQLPLGHVVECLTPHCDPTVNLYDFYYCVREDVLVDIWPIEARGMH